jgi:hypothetical protein
MFEVVLRHGEGESRFVNCSIDNAMDIIQTDLLMRGINDKLTIPVFWDIVFNRKNKLNIDLYDLVNSGNIYIRKTYR